MKNNIIWVDLDEVLAESIDQVLKDNDWKIWDLVIDKKDITNYYVHNIDGTNLNLHSAIDLFRQTFKNDIDLCISPVIWAVEKLSILKEKWYKIAIVTARNEDFDIYTEKWIEKHFPNLIDSIHYCTDCNDVTIPKSEVCLKHGISCFIEDNYFYANDIAKAWIKTYLLEKPWNNYQEEYHENIIKIKSWDEFMK